MKVVTPQGCGRHRLMTEGLEQDWSGKTQRGLNIGEVRVHVSGRPGSTHMFEEQARMSQAT